MTVNWAAAMTRRASQRRGCAGEGVDMTKSLYW